jgi:hypothetical protein
VYRYLVRWPFTADAWEKLLVFEGGRLLYQWITATIQAAWESLNEDDRRAVDWHRTRSSGRTPFDEPHVPIPDLGAVLEGRRPDHPES